MISNHDLRPETPKLAGLIDDAGHDIMANTG